MQGNCQRDHGYILFFLSFLLLLVYGSGFSAEEHLRSHDGKENPSGDGEGICLYPQIVEDIIPKDHKEELDQEGYE